MLGDAERQLLARLNDAETALRDARAEALVQKRDDIVIELRIVVIALLAIRSELMNELQEYKQDNDQ